MKCMTKYVALDVHQATTVASVRAEGGRVRTKRNLWAYAGLAVVTKSTAEYEFAAGRPVRRQRAPMTRGLNRNYIRVLKDVFKGAATATTGRLEPLGRGRSPRRRLLDPGQGCGGQSPQSRSSGQQSAEALA